MNDKILASLQGEAGFRAVVQYATVGILVINSDGDIQLVNPFIESYFGYTAAELIGRPVEVLVPDALQKSHISRRQAYFSNPRNRSMGYGLELFARKKNGAEFPVEISLGHYKLEGEHLAVAFITDITTRKKAEEKAGKLEKEYRFIFEGIRESFMLQQIVRDKNNKINDLLFLDVNQAAEELIGRKRDEIIGHLRSEFLGKLDEDMLQVLERVDKGETVRYEQYFQRLGRWFDRRFYRHKPGQLVTLSIDITKQKKDEAFLRESKARLELETSALSFLNESGTRLARITNLQEGLEQVLTDAIALTRAEKGNIQLYDQGKKVLTIAAQKGFGEEFLSYFAEVFAGEGSVCAMALRDKTQVNIEDIDESGLPPDFVAVAQRSGYRAVQSTPLFGYDGAPLGMISTHFQSARKFNSQDLQKMSLLAQKAGSFLERCLIIQSLEEKVAERTLALARALEKQKELSETKSRFLSVASHEFRTPLSTILSSASLIEAYNTPEHEPHRNKHINRIKAAVKNLTGILNDFLSLQKLEQAKVDIQPEQLNLHQLAREMTEELADILKAGQQIDLLYKGGETVIQDRKILRCIFLNLLSNASKYSAEGKPIYLSVRSEPGTLSIWVKDEGIGIPEEEQQNLFGNFYRAKNAAGIQGTGLGLNIVKRHVELLNGKIRFTSVLNKGTTFFVMLPNAEGPGII